MRENIHLTIITKIWYGEASILAGLVGASPTMPRICPRQTKRDNQPADKPETYYRITATSQLLDHLNNQLSLWFDTSQLNLVNDLMRVSKQGRASWNTDFMGFAQIYLNNLPEMKSLKAEMDIQIQSEYHLKQRSCKVDVTISN